MRLLQLDIRKGLYRILIRGLLGFMLCRVGTREW